MDRSPKFKPEFEALEERQVPSAVGTPNQNFVDQVYQDLLHRPSDTAGRNAFASALDSGRMTRAQVVQTIESSGEGQATLVNDVYTRFLHRSADAAGEAYWSSYLASGHSTAQLEAAVLGSSEYANLHNTGAGTVANAMYEDLFGRPVDSIGALLPLNPLALVEGAEGRNHEVMGYFTSYLRRPGDPAGLSYWSSQFGQTTAPVHLNNAASPATGSQTSDAVVLANMLASDEYFQKAQTNESAAPFRPVRE